jgi:hypothetical protein
MRMSRSRKARKATADAEDEGQENVVTEPAPTMQSKVAEPETKVNKNNAGARVKKDKNGDVVSRKDAKSSKSEVGGGKAKKPKKSSF